MPPFPPTFVLFPEKQSGQRSFPRRAQVGIPWPRAHAVALEGGGILQEGGGGEPLCPLPRSQCTEPGFSTLVAGVACPRPSLSRGPSVPP